MHDCKNVLGLVIGLLLYICNGLHDLLCSIHQPAHPKLYQCSAVQGIGLTRCLDCIRTQSEQPMQLSIVSWVS